MIQLIKKENSPVANAYQTLKTFQGRKLSKMYHQAFPQAYYDKSPFGYSEMARGIWKHPSGINLLVCFDGSFQLF
jgi:hypothetical protein